MHLFLMKACVILVIKTTFIVDCVTSERLHHQGCLSFLNGDLGKCGDWRKMSVLVADLVGRSAIDDDRVEIKSFDPPNALALLIRAASGVIGRGADALKTIIVNGLVLLTQTILTVSAANRSETGNKTKKAVPGGRPIDWILNNPYIKSMTDDAIDETLHDRLERLASGMPCVQLLVCRLSTILRDMQRRVKADRAGRRGPEDGPAWNVSDWRRVKVDAKYCAEKHEGCANAA